MVDALWPGSAAPEPFNLPSRYHRTGFWLVPSAISQEKLIRIAIIGTGNVGGAIAQGLKDKGHAVTLGAYDPSAPDLIAPASRAGSLSIA